VRWPSSYPTTTLTIMLALAILELITHFCFFLHITLAKSARDDLWQILCQSAFKRDPFWGVMGVEKRSVSANLDRALSGVSS
jgi:hypothetical protein